MKIEDVISQKDQFFFHWSPLLRGGVYLGILLGIGCLGAGFFMGHETRAWGSFLFNLMFFFSIALGGVVFGNMQDIIGAMWGRPIKRLHEGFYSFLPFSLVCFFTFFISIKFGILKADHMYPWIVDHHMLEHFEGKKDWLKVDFMLIRDSVALIVIFLLARWHIGMTVRRDLAMLQGDMQKAKELGESTKQSLRHWSAPVMFIYAVCFSLIAFDLTMSLAPTWLSTLWGGWSFGIMMQLLMATILLVMFALKDTPIGHVIQRKQFHDIGKFLHGFTVFFAYLTYAHILTYWYTNMPEETSYFFTRLENPWFGYIIASPILAFVIPFFGLIPRASKWTPHVTVPICIVVVIAQWISYFLVVMPEVVKPSDMNFPWIEIGTFFGFLSAFLMFYIRFGQRVPMIGIADPLLKNALADH